MNLNEVYQYWQQADYVKDYFNDVAKQNGYYWINALSESDNKTIRVTDEKCGLVSESFRSMQPPYFLIPHFLFNHFTGLSLRTIDGDNDFTWNNYGLKLYSSHKTVESTDRFEFGDPLVLCEGPMDAEVLSKGYDYVFALLGSNLTTTMANVLATLTDFWIIVPDNDEAGRGEKGLSKKIYRRASEVDHDVRFEVLDIPEGYKDPGDYFKYGDEMLLNQLKMKLQTTVRE